MALQEATNTFARGMNLDVPDMQAPAEAYTSALNVTLTTSDGNELVLQSDMGNGKILFNNKNITLPLNFIPIGIKEYGGVIYFALCNPNDTDSSGRFKCLLGTFPSPNYKEGLNNLNTPVDMYYKYSPLLNLILDENDSNGEFTTYYLDFDLMHEVSIDIQPSYDGSVNIILTDGKNKPRLINSYFAVLLNNKCSIIKHIGDNNTNIYDGSAEIKFDLSTSLQKLSHNLAKILYDGLTTNGQLRVGGYVIYIKASDEDENTTDVIAESGIIPVFLGTDGDPKSINGLCGDYRTDKAINITVSNLDSTYSHVLVYYSRATSNINEAVSTTCFRLPDLYPIENGQAKVCITGFENAIDVNESEVNTLYFIVKNNKAATLSNNITFIGNVSLENENFETLRKLSLHIIPYLKYTNFDSINNREGSSVNCKDFSGEGYYHSKNVYNIVGYMPDEFYRFGIVYIFSNGSKSSVFNILGVNNLEDKSLTTTNEDSDGSDIFQKNALEYGKYANINEDINLSSNGLYILDSDSEYEHDYEYKYNAKGVCRLRELDNLLTWDIASVSFEISLSVALKLQDLGVVGYFFVRLKRVPVLLCQAYTTPVFENAFIPAIKYGASITGKFMDPLCGYSAFSYFGGDGTYPLDIMKSMPTRTMHTYLVESFFNTTYDVSEDSWDFTVENKSADVCNSPATIFIPFLDKGQSPSLNSEDVSLSGNDWKLREDYTTRLVTMLERGYIWTCHGYSKLDNEVLDNTGLRYSHINGPDIINSGKRGNDTRGRGPVSELLLGGAYAGFCPEYEVNLDYFNTLFSGLDFYIKIKSKQPHLYKKGTGSERVYYYPDDSCIYEKINSREELKNLIPLYNISKYLKNNPAWVSLRNNKDFLYIPNFLIKSKILAVADGVSLMGILRSKEDLDWIHSNLAYQDPWGNKYYDDPQFKLRDTIYFSTKVGEASSSTVFKEVGSDRVMSFGPLFNEYSIKLDEWLDPDKNEGKNAPINICKSNYTLLVTNKEELTATDIKTLFNNKASNLASVFLFSEREYPTNLVRGLYGPYLGIYIPEEEISVYGADLDQCIISIYIPGYKDETLDTDDDKSGSEWIANFRKTLMTSLDPYYTISDYITLENKYLVTRCFRGDCYTSACSHRINRNFLDSASPSNDTVVSEDGFMKYLKDSDYHCLKLYDSEYLNINSDVTKKSSEGGKLEVNTTNIGDINAIKLGSWINFTIRSTMNLSLRGEDRTYPTEKLLMGQYRSFYPLYGVNIGGSGKIPDSTAYNKGYSISGGIKKYVLLNTESYINTYFKDRIYYSNVDVTSFYTNGSRTILATHHRDYDTKYGEIIKLIDTTYNSYGALLCVLEHGLALIPILPQALVSEGTAGTTYINTSNVLPEKWTIISETLGSLYKQSIVETPYYIYGVDTYLKKIWRVRGGLVEIISDDNINSFLNDYLTINNEALETGKIMLRALYNASKKDVIFSFYSYDELDNNNNVLWSICYNETLSGNASCSGWVTFYSWISEISANIGNSLISFDHKQIKNIIDKTYTIQNGRVENSCYLWKHGPALQLIISEDIRPTKWYGLVQPMEIEFVVNLSPANHKVFTDMMLLGNKAAPESFHYELVGLSYDNVIDKATEYYRLERTKLLWNKANSPITYDPNYTLFTPVHRPLYHYEGDLEVNWQNSSNYDYINIFVKSLVPWNYYIRTHDPNEIENYYYLITNNSRNYAYLTGSELVHNKRGLELRIQVHAKGIDMDGPSGILRGNMRYKEDIWYVQINPILYKEKNEPYWTLPPIIINNTLIPTGTDLSNLNNVAFNLLGLSAKDFDTTQWGERKSMKLRDKYMKIRIRYSGNDKVFLLAVKTLYQNSYI